MTTTADSYDDDDPADRRAARVLRRFHADVDRARTADDLNRAAERLQQGLRRARMHLAGDDD